MRVAFVVPGEPVGKGRPRATRVGAKAVRMYTPAKTLAYEQMVATYARQQYKGAPLDQPVRVTMHIDCQIPASWSAKKRQAAINGDIHPTGKPDIDNTQKAVFDALNGIVWTDDSRVVDVRASKRYETRPCLFVMIETMDEVPVW